MTAATPVLPNQLFADHPAPAKAPDKMVLFYAPLLFGDPQYPAAPHKQVLWLHRHRLRRSGYPHVNTG